LINLKQITVTMMTSKISLIISRGDYLWQINDHIGYRYEILSSLGKGSFGQVLKVHDHKRKEDSALKIIKNKKKFYNQAMIELKILKFIKETDLNNSSNIVKIKDFIVFRNHVVINLNLF
jgi:dual specificity tyrosine-phosphorylation-regulated kinase 2/3/4